jgi:hypothetical protein
MGFERQRTILAELKLDAERQRADRSENELAAERRKNAIRDNMWVEFHFGASDGSMKGVINLWNALRKKGTLSVSRVGTTAKTARTGLIFFGEHLRKALDLVRDHGAPATFRKGVYASLCVSGLHFARLRHLPLMEALAPH